MINYTQKDIDRFYNKISVIEEGENAGCWKTNYYKNKQGYPQIRIKQTGVLCSRFMYHIWHPNEDIYGKVIRHTCDNPECVCPDHLLSGTQQDNMKDMVDKGRQTKGEGKAQSILTEVEVINILNSILNNTYTSLTDLSIMFSTSKSNIGDILHGRTWVHITKNYDLNKIDDIIKRNKRKLTDSDICDIKQRLKNNETGISISRMYNVSICLISRIKNNTYKR